MGVEEELLLVDPDSGRPRSVAAAVLREAHAGDTAAEEAVDSELQQEQLEIETAPSTSLEDLGTELRRWRQGVAAAARKSGAEVAALATSPVPVEPTTTPKTRYQRMVEEFGLTAQEQLTCGCHIHVGVASAEEGVAVLDRVRPWLPALLAVSANSPFWHGRDSGYASYRSRVWDRWLSAGPTELFGSPEAYRATVDALLDTRTLLDEGMVYFHARLSRLYPTVELRVADICLHLEDAVLLAALGRALVETAVRAWQGGEPPAPVRTELLRVATWRAGRSGLDGDLVHPRTGRPAPAPIVLWDLVDHLTPALTDAGDLDVARQLLGTVLARGTGARIQRDVHRRSGEWAEVVRDAVRRTTLCAW